MASKKKEARKGSKFAVLLSAVLGFVVGLVAGVARGIKRLWNVVVRHPISAIGCLTVGAGLAGTAQVYNHLAAEATPWYRSAPEIELGQILALLAGAAVTALAYFGAVRALRWVVGAVRHRRQVEAQPETE